MTPSQRAQATAGYLASHPGEVPMDFRHVLINPSGKSVAMKKGDILLTIPLAEMENYMQLRLDIAFGEPRAIQGKPVLELLHELTNVIRAIIIRFYNAGLCK